MLNKMKKNIKCAIFMKKKVKIRICICIKKFWKDKQQSKNSITKERMSEGIWCVKRLSNCQYITSYIC